MQRVMSMRKLLRAAVERKGTPGTWGHITAQIGLFSFTGLTVAQSESMTNDYHIYSASWGGGGRARLSLGARVAYCARARLFSHPPPLPLPQCSTLAASMSRGSTRR